MRLSVPLWMLILGIVAIALVSSVASALASFWYATYLHSLQKAIASNPVQEDPSVALARTESYIIDGKLQNAYDTLLVAMRLAPGDKRVFDISLNFVQKAHQSNDEEMIALAHDIYQRIANLIPFLPLEQIEKARVDYTKLGDELFLVKKAANSQDPFDEAESLLKAAQSAHIPAVARSRLVHEVDTILNSQARRVALTAMKSTDDEKIFWERWKAVKARHEAAQKDVLTALYQEACRPRIISWSDKVNTFFTHRAEAQLEQIDQVNTEIYNLIVEGERHKRDLTAYLEGGVEAAIKDAEEIKIDTLLSKLARLREWNYNRWALNHIDNVKSNQEFSTLKKLETLAFIDESRLAQYFMQRFVEAWNEFFNKCSDQEKVEATKYRILRGFRP